MFLYFNHDGYFTGNWSIVLLIIYGNCNEVFTKNEYSKTGSL